MAVRYVHRNSDSMQTPTGRSEEVAANDHRAVTAMMTPVATKVIAALRLITGFVFLWAFMDKAFGWGYATPAGKAWVDGYSPTQGFLSHVAVGPLESVFHDWAGAWWVDWLFMLGLLGIGAALMAGVALRFAAAAGTLMMALMWAAEWPPARHLSDGAASTSANPVVDYHVAYAVVLIALAALHAGNTWGLGRRWAALPVVRDHDWLR